MAKQHIGKTLKETNPHVALALEPIVRNVLAKRKAVVDIETEASFSTTIDTHKTGYLLTSCFPLMGETNELLGALAVVRDISQEKLKEAVQDELLNFDALLSDLSAAFINMPVSEVDEKVEQGLQKIVEFLDVDRSTIWNFSPEDGRVHRTHFYSRPGIMQPPLILNDSLQMRQRGEVFKVSDVNELSDEFRFVREFCIDEGGIKSFISFPLNVGGTVVSLLSFASCRVKMWPDHLIQRLRIFWEIFGNAIERKRADQKIQKALAEIRILKERLEAENFYLRGQIETEYKHEEIIGQSSAIRKVLQQVEQVAGTDSTVLILGETGTGKELVARAIHNLSDRKARAMIKLNCATLPATLIEAELFGCEKGAYTGATSTRIGRFEAANGSTIFLDEIGELPLELQSKLLRVLQESQFERLGSTKPITIDVRVIAATNRNLAEEVKAGRFRGDLYYRLNVFPISVPPLRERREDIPALVRAMVQEFGNLLGKTIDKIPKKDMDTLESYRWPGNIRELRNVIERGMILCNGTTLVIDLPDHLVAIPSPTMLFKEMERMHIVSVLESTGWRVSGSQGAAEKLGLKPSTLESKMKKLGIKRKP